MGTANKWRIKMLAIVTILLSFFIGLNTAFSGILPVISRAEKQIVLTGFTRSETTMVLSSEVSGKIIEIHYDIGETIGKKPFVSIDPTFIDFQINQTHQSITEIKIAEKMALQNIRYLKKEFERIDFLHKGDRATEVKRDEAENNLIQAQLKMDELSSRRHMLEITLKELNEKKKRHHIFAPSGWIVVDRQIEVGEIISPSVQLARIANYQHLVVPLSVSSKELHAIQCLPKIFQAEVNENKVQAKINWINPEFNETTRKLSIEIILQNYSGQKRGGLSFSLPLNIKAEGLLVPKIAVTRAYDNPRITLKLSGETINVEVLGESGDHVIIAYDSRLKPGMEVIPLN